MPRHDGFVCIYSLRGYRKLEHSSKMSGKKTVPNQPVLSLRCFRSTSCLWDPPATLAHKCRYAVHCLCIYRRQSGEYADVG
jgi:hypothetical protein